MTLHRGHVLVVDDDAEVRDALQSVLEANGFAVRAASDGSRALESLAKEPAALVVLDLMMPVMSGAEALQRMRGDGALRNIPVVIASAWPEQAKRLRGAQGILRKPIELGKLLEFATHFCAAAAV